MRNSCQVEGWGENNSDAEMQAIKDSIVAESKAANIPKVQPQSPTTSLLFADLTKEFILAIIMQESKGCVRAPTTHWSHDNPGLMQSAQGKGTCNRNGETISPCPEDTIRLMIHDGTDGEDLETTLKQCLADAGTSDDSKWYKAARLYNAGRITDNNLGIGPTPCYTSDIANRLTNPFNWSSCNNAIIGTLSSAQGTIDQGNSDLKGSTPTTNTADVPSVAPDLIISGAAAECTDYYIPQSGDTCLSAPVDFATLRALNTHLDSKCTNLWAGYAYCIAV